LPIQNDALKKKILELEGEVKELEEWQEVVFT
jgi:hypothetical protein